MKEYEPNELIVDKVCSLWIKMLSNPKFDALGKDGRSDDPNGSMEMASMLATMNATQIKTTEEQLVAFAKNLKTLLMEKTNYDTEAKKLVFADDGFYMNRMGVDYHPDMVLSQAAEDTGLHPDIFPWKTMMWIEDNHLSLSYGYGAESMRYYPVDGKWLVTTLSGSDISKVIEYVRGNKPEFVIE